jgi:predicted ATPase/DNA-binding SARP family transcriptional activator
MAERDVIPATLHIGLLGDFRLVHGDLPVTSVNTSRLQALLAYLVLHRDAPQSRKHLAFLFWPDTSEAQAFTNLRNLLHKLRQALPDPDRFFEADGHAVSWRRDAPYTLDVAEFDTLAQSAARADLAQAVELYRGDLLPSCYDDWIMPERERRQQTVTHALMRLIETLEASRDYKAAISYGPRLRQLDPLNEETHRTIMRLHAANQDHTGVLRAYHTCVKILQDEFGAHPAPETRELYERLLQSATAPPLPAVTAPERSRMIGRQAEWQTLLAAWRAACSGRPGCVLLTGEAGIGKTRLAEELLGWADRQGFRVAAARCDAAEEALAYAPVVAWLHTPALSQRLAALEPAWATEVARLLPELLPERPGLAQPGPVGEANQRQRLFEGLSRAVLERGKPLLLLIDDLQWCDRDTIEWLHFLLRFDPRASLLILGTARGEDVVANPPLGALLAALRRDGQVTELALAPLSADDSLPVPPTLLLGRQEELARIAELLTNPGCRLLSLLGPGGIGKTRLAIQAAANLADRFQDGVFFVNLAPINDRSLVEPTIAQVLGVRETPGWPLLKSLKDHLATKDLLLLLDNFEQVTDAAPSVAALLAGAPRLKVLVTSRARLHVRGEKEFRVAPLALPPVILEGKVALPHEVLAQYPALALFVQRAQDATPDFVLTNENAPAIAEICRQLDGLPLAIELAAARIKILSPEAILARLVNRLKVLTGGARDLPARQQTLRNAIAWSYDLLHAGDKKLFQRLALFAGGATLEAAEAVCNAGDSLDGAVLDGDVLDGMESLIDKSLLFQQAAPGGELRFAMLATIREYALERLAESSEAPALRRAYVDFFLRLAEEAEPKLRSGEQAQWLDRLETEHNNLRAALEWSNADEFGSDIGLRLAGALCLFWEIRDHVAEGRVRLAAALARDKGAVTPFRARVLVGAGTLAWRQGDHVSATALHEEALAAQRGLGDRRGMARSLINLGVQAYEQGDHVRATALHEEALAAQRALGDRQGMAGSLHNLGGMTLYQGSYEQAARYFQESLALSKELQDWNMVGRTLTNLGELARHEGNYGRAAALYNESLALARELKAPGAIFINLTPLGIVEQYLGNYEKAAADLRESLILGQQLGFKRGIAECLEGLAGLANARRLPDRAAQLAGAADALRQAISSPLPPVERTEYDRTVAGASALLGEEGFASAWTAGRGMTLEQAIAAALASPASG